MDITTNIAKRGSYAKFNPSIGSDTEMRGSVSTRIFTRLQSISCMAEYRNNSLEEIRLEDYRLGRNKGNCTTTFGHVTLQAGESISNMPTAFTNIISTNSTNPIKKTICQGTDVKFLPVYGTDTMMRYGTSTNVNTRYQSITCMVPYEKKSFEELRFEDYILGRKDGIDGENSRNSKTFQPRYIHASSQSGDELINKQSENGDKYCFSNITPQPARLILRGNRVCTRTTVGNFQRFAEDIQPIYGRFPGNGAVLNCGSSLAPELLQNALTPFQNSTPPIRNPRRIYQKEKLQNRTVLRCRRILPQEQPLLTFQISSPPNKKDPPNYQRENEMFSGTAGYISSTQVPENVFITNFIYNGIPADSSGVDPACEMIPQAFRFGQQRGASSQIYNSLNTNLNAGIRMINARKPPTIAITKTDQRENSSKDDESHSSTVGKLPLCLLCEDNEREIVFAPCGHLVACRQCGIKVKANCPVCRKFITNKIKTYIS